MSRRDASLRQRRYSFADHGNSVAGNRQGKFLIKNNLAQHWTPCWGDGVTVIRPFPARNPEDTTGISWDPYRFSAEHRDFGDWLRCYPAVRSFGDPGVTMIIRDPADPTALDPQRLPAWVLFNAIDRAVAAGQDQQGWAALLRGGRNRGAVLSRPSEVYLIQGAIMQHKTEVYNPPRGFAPEEKPLVLELSMNAGTSLIAELEKQREGHQAVDGDWENMFLNGDPVSLDYGRFITFYKLADGDPRQRQAQQAGGWNAPQQQQAGGRTQDPIGYGCYLEPSFNGISARLRDFERQIAAKVQNWDDILWFPTIEEQANLIADKFPPEVIMYAWRDRPEWIPENIRNRAVAAHSVNAPAGGWQQGWGPGQPGQAAPAVAAAGGFSAPPAGGFGGATGQPQFPQPGQPQFPQGAPPQGQVPGGFGAPTGLGAPSQGRFPQGAAPQGQFPQGQFPQGGQPAPAPQPAPQGGFGAPTSFGAPPTGFGAPAGHDPSQMAGQPNYSVPSGPTGGPPPAAPAGGYPRTMSQGQFPPPGQPQFPQGAPPQGQPAPQAQMNWANQNSVAPNLMGQTPDGFAAPTGQPQYQQPQYQQLASAPPASAPPAGAPMGRAAAALAAAQAAAGGQPQG